MLKWPSFCLLAFACPIVCCRGADLLRNADFAKLDGGKPVSWQGIDFGTGGAFLVNPRDGHREAGCAVLRSATRTQRSCWRQRANLPPGTLAVTAGGWYRNAAMDAMAAKGASLRVHFYRREEGAWKEILLRQFFFPVREAWSSTGDRAVPVPAGAEAVELQLFHWLAPGETRWDDVWLRTVNRAELPGVRAQLAEGLGLDRNPVFGRNLPYSPARGEKVKTNPPPFLWLPAGKGSRYDLQVCRTPDFTGPSLKAVPDLQWCAHMLTEPLEPGTWYWRYGVRLETVGTVWSKTREFTVPGDATRWPYPKVDRFTVTPRRPRLFVRPGGLAELRRRAARGNLRQTAVNLVRSVGSFAGEALVPEPEWLPEGAARGPAYTLTFRATRPPMDKMEQAALAYLLTGDPAAGREARRRVLHFFSWDPRGPTNVLHNDEPAMWIMMRGVRAYDWTYDLYGEAERKTVEEAMRERARDFYTKLSRKPFENNPYDSHAGRIIGFLGEAAISFAPEWEEARMWLDYITRIYWGVYPAWGKEDGGWNEGPGYWSAYMSFGLHFVLALREATGIDLSKRPFFRNTPYYKLYIAPPYSRMSPFGDGSQFRPSRPTALMYWFSTLLQDPHIRWYPEALNKGPGNNILGVILRDDELNGFPPIDLPQARHFPAVGLVSLHTAFGSAQEDVSFTMRSSPYGAVSHGHNDQNCFVLEAYGEALAIATGHYNRYGSPHHDQWTRQTKAKCGITTDGGVGQDRGRLATGSITDFVHGAGFDLVRGDATRAYGGRLSKAIREVVHVRPGIFVIRDDLASEKPRRFEYWLHALERMEVEENLATVTIRRPKAALTTRFLSPAQLAFTQTDAFDVPPTWPPGKEFSNQWHLRASAPAASKTGGFLTVLMPSRAGREADLPRTRRIESRDMIGVRLEWQDGRRAVVAFAGDVAERIRKLEGIRTDGTVCAVGLAPDGRPERWLLRSGTILAWNDTNLVESERPTTSAAGKTEYGMRLDSGGERGKLNVWCPYPVRYLRRGRDGQAQPAQPTEKRFTLVLRPDAPSAQLWERKPPRARSLRTRLKAPGGETVLSGRITAFGDVFLGGTLDLPAGSYRPVLPDGFRWRGGVESGDGRLWLTGKETVGIQGRGVPQRMRLDLLERAVVLPGRSRGDLPPGFSFEAEENWREEGGEIKVSRGGHAGTSGNANLWAWNKPGHRLIWTLDIPEEGNYEVWFVGATRTGCLVELQVDDQTPALILLEPTGGWGRKRKQEWQAFHPRTGTDRPLVATFRRGSHRISLTNRQGMGLNLDRIVLCRQ